MDAEICTKGAFKNNRESGWKAGGQKGKELTTLHESTDQKICIIIIEQMV